MNPEQDRRERSVAKAMLVLCPLPMVLMLVIVCMGLAPGLAAGHPIEYLQATCVVWIPITMVLPLLRLLRIVSFPRWFEALIYLDMYVYVYSLSCGLYFNISWWGDFTHVVSSMVVSCIVLLSLSILWNRSPPHVSFGGIGGLCFMCFVVSMSFGGIWEVMEALTDMIAGTPYMVYGATDTLGDLTSDFIGAAILSICAYLRFRNRDREALVAGLRFGRRAFDVDD